MQGFFWPAHGAEYRPHSQCQMGWFFPNFKKKFPIRKIFLRSRNDTESRIWAPNLTPEISQCFYFTCSKRVEFNRWHILFVLGGKYHCLVFYWQNLAKQSYFAEIDRFYLLPDFVQYRGSPDVIVSLLLFPEYYQNETTTLQQNYVSLWEILR